MKQVELVNAIKDVVGGEVSKADINNVLKLINEIMLKNLHYTGKINILGLGNLTVQVRAERQGHNPRTGEIIDIPSKNVARFKPSKALKAAINV